MDIHNFIEQHGTSKVRALIPLRPLHVYCGIIALTSSNDEAIPILCEVDESRYKVSDKHKIGWKPIAPFAPAGGKKLRVHDVPGFASESYYQSDFDGLVKEGYIKVFVEVQ